MSGFQHDIAGGGGDLIVTQLQSPNFSEAGETGWAILKSGAAFFYDITLPSGTSIKVTFAATAPAGPNVGDIWYNTSAGLEVSQWNGSAWVAYQIGAGAIVPGSITASLIAANTITAGQLAAGIVYAGIVNGTTITGAQFVAYGSTGEILVYSGTPAAGNLITSVSASAGTDSFGNHYLAGTATYANSSGIATALAAGYVAFCSGSLSGGWSALSSVSGDTSGNVQVNASSELQLIGSGGVTIQGSSNTGYGGPGGTVTGGPNSGSFAGHTHDFLGHYHSL